MHYCTGLAAKSFMHTTDTERPVRNFAAAGAFDAIAITYPTHIPSQVKALTEAIGEHLTEYLLESERFSGPRSRRFSRTAIRVSVEFVDETTTGAELSDLAAATTERHQKFVEFVRPYLSNSNPRAVAA